MPTLISIPYGTTRSFLLPVRLPGQTTKPFPSVVGAQATLLVKENELSPDTVFKIKKFMNGGITIYGDATESTLELTFNPADTIGVIDVNKTYYWALKIKLANGSVFQLEKGTFQCTPTAVQTVVNS